MYANEATADLFRSPIAKRGDKAAFIYNLGMLLSQTREGIESARLLSNGTDDEFVVIKYNNGHEKKIDISCDSYMAIIRDVAKNI